MSETADQAAALARTSPNGSVTGTGPWAQARSVRRMEPTAQAQLGPLGLAGFIVVTFIATGIDAGVLPERAAPVLAPVGFFIGGLAQLLAGLFQTQRGDTWHATVFGSFGLFWCAKAVMLKWVLPGMDPSARGAASGVFTLPWVFVVFVLWLASWRIHVALLGTFSCVLVVFVAMAVAGFTDSTTWNRVAGWSGLLAAAGALYLLAGQVMASTWGRPVLPMGQLRPPDPAD
ncbi:succinate-acetate transporter protein [Streptacidiphilus sp. MAP12-33]|uniref:acetate uptake transporter n=1 Tax=Streptacidiphilus sp. MAP12-33 TaxID=3156266 RepID=UPI0035166CB3